jgi:PTS system nitrogen regulatory IIA component
MRMSQLLSENLVISDLPEGDKEETLERLAKLVAEVIPEASKKKVLEVFLEREKVSSTGIGYGIAVPHGKLEDLQQPLIVLARSFSGVAFDALDGKPVHLIVALLSPAKAGKEHLEALSLVSRILLQDRTTRERLMAAEDRGGLYKVALSGCEKRG